MTAAIVLAAGRASRYAGGGHKLLAPFRGRPLLAWAVEHALGAGIGPTLVVTGSVDVSAVLPAGVIVVPNPEWPRGMATSIRAGLDWATSAGHGDVVVGLGDQPLVPASAWRAVAASPSPIAVATFAGERRPPVRLSAEVWPLLPHDGDVGARALMDSRPELVLEVPCDGEAVDVDTVEDLARWG